MLKRLYEKSEIWFAVGCIITYVVLASIGDNLSASIGIMKSITVPILVILSVVIFLFIKNNQMMDKYGFCKSVIPASKMLYYIPVFFMLTANLWFGVAWNMSPLETALYIFSMMCVGFLEEIIFRGFLFNAMLKDGEKSAIIVSSVTFGIGHIVNLMNGSGAELLPNLLQVCYAIAAGFMFVMIYYKTKSLWICIIAHAVFNSLSVFSNEAALTNQKQIISAILLIIITGGYAFYIAYVMKENR